MEEGGDNNCYKCNKCDQTFRVFSDLQSHIQMHNKSLQPAFLSPGKKHKCNLCGAMFPRHSGLKVHNRLHVKIDYEAGADDSLINYAVSSDEDGDSGADKYNNAGAVSSTRPYNTNDDSSDTKAEYSSSDDDDDGEIDDDNKSEASDYAVPGVWMNNNNARMKSKGVDEVISKQADYEDMSAGTRGETCEESDVREGVDYDNLDDVRTQSDSDDLEIEHTLDGDEGKKENARENINLRFKHDVSENNEVKDDDDIMEEDDDDDDDDDMEEEDHVRFDSIKEKPLNAAASKKPFITTNFLKKYLQTHMPEEIKKTSGNSLQCLVCGKTFSCRRNLRNHGTIHTGERPYRCDECGKTFRHGPHLKQHKMTHSGERPHHCDQCDKAFSRKYDLTRHMKLHTVDKPYICGVCSMDYTTEALLLVHMRIHSGEKAHKCEYCGKQFDRKSTQAKHVRTHTGERPYTCGECSKSFNNKNDLNKHIRIHTGVKPYKCTECDKAFTQIGSLKIHSRTHSGEKPYKCYVCGKCFGGKSGLNRHLKIHIDKNETSEDFPDHDG